MKDMSYRTGRPSVGEGSAFVRLVSRSVVVLIMAVVATAITACTGGGGDGGSAQLTAVQNAQVEDSLGRSPDNVINAQTVDQVEVVIEVPSSAREGDEIDVILSDGITEIVTTVPAPPGGGSLVVGPIDATSLQDGPITMTVVMRRGDEELITQFGAVLFLDTTPPLAAEDFAVPAGANNPVGIANQNTAAGVVTTVTFAAGGDAADLATIFITDGVSVVQSLAENVSPGNVVTFQPINVSELADGVLQVTVQTVDAAENTSDFASTFTKDTSIASVTAARIAAGPNNAQDLVNSASERNVTVELDVSAEAQADDVLGFVISDGNGYAFTMPAQSPGLGGGTVFYAPINLEDFQDGPITLTATITDANGNQSQFAVSTPTKDSSLSRIVNVRFIDEIGADHDRTVIGGNPTLAKVRVVFDAPALANESMVFTFTHLASSMSISTATQAVTAGQASQVFGTFDLSAFPEGDIRIDVAQSDTSGNTFTGRGEDGFIDRTAHSGPTAGNVTASGGNPIHVVNMATEGSVQVSMTVPAYDDDQVTARVILGDGSTEIVSAYQNVPAAGGTMTFSGLDGTALVDGGGSLEVEFLDLYGNVSRFPMHAFRKDTFIALPTAAFVAAGTGNAQDQINASNVSNVSIDVVLPSSALDSDMFALQVTDGTTTVNVPAQSAPGSGGTMTFGGIDLSSLAEGPVAISVAGLDNANNQNIFVGSAATKDTEVPTASSARVAAGPTNGANRLNATNDADPMMEIRFEDVGTDDTFRIQFSDADGNSVSSAPRTIASAFAEAQASGGVTPDDDDFETPDAQSSDGQRIGDFAAVIHAGVDLRSLNDGPITIKIRLDDTNGNFSNFVGTPATKASQPNTPTAASVQPGAGNAADVINQSSVSAVAVQVVMPSGSTSDDMVKVRLADTGSFVESAPQAAPMGGGAMNFTIDASSLVEGAIQIVAYVENATRHPGSFQGTAAVKDTIAPSYGLVVRNDNAPASPASGSFDSESGSSTGLSDNSVGAAQADSVDATFAFDGTNAGGETVDITLTDGVTSLVLATGMAMPSNTVYPVDVIVSGSAIELSFTGLDFTGFNDGVIVAQIMVHDDHGNTTDLTQDAFRLDTAPPAAPLGLTLPAGATWPENVANTYNAASARVVIQTNPAGQAGDEIAIVIADGAHAPTVAATATVVTPGAPLIVSGIDLSGLDDGMAQIQAVATDHANSAEPVRLNIVVDQTPPAVPVSVGIAMSGATPANTVSSATVSSVSIDVGFDAQSEDINVASGTVTDGSSTVTLSSQNATAGMGSISFSGIDLSGLADGMLTITIEVVDPHANRVTFVNSSILKDTVIVATTAADVPAGGGNAANVVNASNVSSVGIDVAFDAAADGTESATVTVTDGAMASVSYMQQAITAGGGTQSFGPMDLSSLADGSLTITVTVTDPNGNSRDDTYAATKDATVPSPATAAAIPNGGATMPGDTINDATKSSVSVDVTFPATSQSSDLVTVTLGDGLLTAQSSATAAPAGAGTITIGGIDASLLMDGAISISVDIVDTAGNPSGTFTGTAATKDVVAPTAPTMAVVPMGAMNPAGFVTAATEPSAQIDVSFGASSAATDSVFVDVVDGSMGTVTSMAQAAPSGAGTSNFTGLDLSSLAEGSLTITATVRDAAGNEATVGGSATKDTVIVAVTSAAIPAAAGNAENGISATNLTTVSVDVAFDAAADGTESATVVIEDGSMNTVSYGSQSIPMGGGTVSFGPMDATGLTDGMITITVTTIDPSGNSVDTVVNGVKDVSAPAMASAAAIPSTATNNPADFVNIATDGGARVDVTLGAGSVATDTVTVTLDDGMTSVQGQAAASAGAGTVSVTGIDTSSLAEGAITISVDVTDQAGNSSGAFAGTAATKDVTAPADPIVDPVTSPWNTITQDVTGSADAGVGLEVDGGAASATGTADMAGFYSVTVTLAAATTNSLTVRARDAAGNPSMDVTTDWAAGALDVTHLATAPPVPFTEVAATVGLADTGNADGGSFADIDGDGDLDLFVGQGAAGLLYVNDGTGSFTEESGTRGGPFVGDRGGVWGDYDNDGDLDLLTVDSTAGTTLYANDGAGVFTDVTVAETANIASATLTQVFWLDHDQDGFLDFFALDSNTANGNVVMVNQRGAMSPTNTFVAAVGTGAETGVTAPMSGAVADFDVDGDIDLLFGDGAMGQFLSNAAGSYSGVGGVSFDHSGGRSPITFVDYDNDGDFDLYIARGGASSVNQLWRNDGGSFTEVAVSAGLDTDVTADDVCWGDLDHDGRIDLYVGSNGANKFYLNRGDIDTDGVWEFIELSAATGIAINDGGDADLVQMADVDGDGDLDLFVGNEGTANVFYRNTLASARYLKVRVSGQGLGAGTASSDARGAVVTLKLTDGTIIATREISGGRGKGSQDSSEIHFGGIAPSRQYDVVISFPSGNTAMQTVTPRLLANQTLVISE